MESRSTNRLQMKEAVKTAWPAVLESFFIAFAGMIDTMMVASLGTYAVAATGLTIQPKFITLAVFFAINIAVSALVARRRGEQDQTSANQIFVTAIAFSLIVCILLTILNIYFADTLMRWSGSNPETHQAAANYFKIIIGGMVFSIISMVINAAQRGIGNTKIAMTTNVTSSIVNICFNYLLINGHFGFPSWQIKGAAIATVLGTVVACFMSIYSLTKKDNYISFHFIIQNRITPSWKNMLQILSLGANILVENIAMRIGFLVTAILAANLGTDTFAAHQVGMHLLSLGFAFGDGMQIAAVALIGRSLGERNTVLAKSYGNICQKIGLGISCILSLILLFAGRFIFSAFFPNPEIIHTGTIICGYMIIILLFQISQIIFGGCLRGAGDVRYTLFSALISVTIIRSIVTFILVVQLDMGIHGIWLGVLSDQISRFTLLGLRFRKGDWVHLKI